MCQIKSVRTGHEEESGTLTCGPKPLKLCADVHIYNWAGNLCPPFGLHYLSTAKMSSSVHKKASNITNVTNWLKHFTKRIKIKGKRLKSLVVNPTPTFPPSVKTTNVVSTFLAKCRAQDGHLSLYQNDNISPRVSAHQLVPAALKLNIFYNY